MLGAARSGRGSGRCRAADDSQDVALKIEGVEQALLSLCLLPHHHRFCQLGLEHPVPDHSTFSKNRHGRFRESDTFRHLFESVLQRCTTEGLVRGEGFATDASIIKADAQRQRGVPGCEPIDWGNPEAAARPVREYLAGLEEENCSGTTPKAISLTDPAATWTAAPGGPAFYSPMCRSPTTAPGRCCPALSSTPSTRTTRFYWRPAGISSRSAATGRWPSSATGTWSAVAERTVLPSLAERSPTL